MHYFIQLIYTQSFIEDLFLAGEGYKREYFQKYIFAIQWTDYAVLTGMTEISRVFII